MGVWSPSSSTKKRLLVAPSATSPSASRRSASSASTSNLFFVDDEGLHTPIDDLPLLPGVTRSVVTDLIEAETDIPLRRGRYAPEDVREAAEAFLTNTTWEVRPVETVDGVEVGGGPVTNLLARLFDQLVERRHYG